MVVPLDGNYDISIDRVLVNCIFRYEFLKLNRIDLNGWETKHIFDSSIAIAIVSVCNF